MTPTAVQAMLDAGATAAHREQAATERLTLLREQRAAALAALRGEVPHWRAVAPPEPPSYPAPPSSQATGLPLIADGEPVSAAVTNRADQMALQLSGYNPNGSDFAGYAKAGVVPPAQPSHDGDVLANESGAWVSAPLGGGAAVQDDVLTYDAGAWVAKPPPAGGGATLPPGQQDDVLTYDAGAWVSAPLPPGNLPPGQQDDVMQYDAGAWVAKSLPPGTLPPGNERDVLTHDSGGNWVSTPGLTGAVADNTDRDARYPAATAPIGTTVRNLASKQTMRLTSGRAWTVDADTPTGTINVRKYTLGSWYDANGVNTVGSSRTYYITAADVAQMQALGYRGGYYAGIDTRDDVVLQEALLEAYGAPTANGRYVWPGGAGGAGLWLGFGVFVVSRTKWLVNGLGVFIGGEGKFQTLIRGIHPDTTVLYVDGIHTCRFERLGIETQMPYTNACGGARYQGGSFDWSFHHPICDIDWIGSSTPIGGPSHVAPDYTPRTITSADMPYVDRAGSNFVPNALRGKMLVVLDDPVTNQPGQVRRIAWNTSSRIYISGRWDFAPSAQATLLIAPDFYGFARWHGASSVGQEQNILTDFVTDFTALASGSPDGKTLYRFGWNSGYHPSLAHGYPLTTRTITSHTRRTLYLNAPWPTGLVPGPSFDPDPSNCVLGPNGLGEPSTPEYEWCNYAIGGTKLDSNGGANPITTGVENTLNVSGAPYGTNDKVGGWLEIVSCASETGVQTVTSLGDGTQVIVGGITPRTPGADVGMRLFVRSGPGATSGEYAHVTDNGTNWWRLDRGLDIGVTTQIELIDPVKGQILPIIQNTPNSLTTTWEAGYQYGEFHFHYFAKPPRAGDTVIVHERRATVNTQGNTFNQVSWATTGYGDVAFAWTRSGDGSMGSETSFYDCSVSSNRVAMYANGQNVLNLNWYAGDGEGPQGVFYFPRGWMNIHGPGLGGDFDNTLGATQRGPAIVMNQSKSDGVVLDACYIESPMLFGSSTPVVATRCTIGIPFIGFSLNHTWTEGELWWPAQSKGYQYRCVQLFGTGSTAGVSDPTVTDPSYGDEYSPASNKMKLVDGSGNGALFCRLDYIGIASNMLKIVGGSFDQVMCYSDGGSTDIDGGAVFSRPDFMGHAGPVSASNPGAPAYHLGNLSVNPNIVDYQQPEVRVPWTPIRSWSTQPLTPPLMLPNATWISRGLMIAVGQAGGSNHTGLVAFAHPDFNPAAQGTLLALVEAQDQQHPPMQGLVDPTIFGKLPRIGTDQAGTRQRIAGGQGTGAGRSGTLDFEVAPAGASGSAPNPHAVVGRFDDDVTLGNTRFLLYDVSAGTLKRVSVGVADSGGAGYKALRVAN
jgi:hypothetical protein